MIPNKHSEELWEIYQNSFPENERRTLKQQKKIMNNRRYTVIPYLNRDEAIGFLAYWDLSDFIFIEHFAFSSKARGKGFGSKYLKRFLKKVDKPVVLEVEPVTDNITFRRICFYNKLGFKLNEYDYCQPAFEKDKQPVILQLMTHNKKLKYKEFQFVKGKLYRDIYNYY